MKCWKLCVCEVLLFLTLQSFWHQVLRMDDRNVHCTKERALGISGKSFYKLRLGDGLEVWGRGTRAQLCHDLTGSPKAPELQHSHLGTRNGG